MAQQVSKNINGVVNNLTNNPFNIYSVSQEKSKKSPTAFFGSSKRLVNMSPNDYFKLVASQSGTTPEKLMEHRQRIPNELSIDDIRKKMREGVQFDTPWVRLMDSGEKGTVRPYWQEGLHRMLAAGQEYGMDTKFPIYLAYDNDQWDEIDTLPMDDFIKYYDDTRLKRYNMEQERERIQKQEIDDFNRQETADYFNVLLESVTPEMIREYLKYEDSLFKDEWDD